MAELSPIEAIRANATLVVSVTRNELGQELAYDEQTVRSMDGYIQRQHKDGDPSRRDGLVNTLGSLLGECIIHVFGGEWTLVEGSWCIQLADKNAAFSFAKVAKQLENGSADSVLSFYKAIPLVFRASGECD